MVLHLEILDSSGINLSIATGKFRFKVLLDIYCVFVELNCKVVALFHLVVDFFRDEFVIVLLNHVFDHFILYGVLDESQVVFLIFLFVYDCSELVEEVRKLIQNLLEYVRLIL